MGVQTTDDHFVITIPRLAGYKTVTINTALILWSLVSVVYPKLATPDPTALGVLFDQSAASLVAVVGVINLLMRLVSHGKALPALSKPISGGGEGTLDALKSAVAQKQVEQTKASLAAILTSPNEWPIVHGVTHDLQCGLGRGSGCTCERVQTWPVAGGDVVPLAGFMTVSEAGTMLDPPLRVAEALDIDAAQSEARCGFVDHMSIVDGLYGPETFSPPAHAPALRRLALAFLAPFLVPSLMLLGGVALATLPGCAEIQQVSAVAQAESVQQRAFALYGTFVVLEERAAGIIQDRRIPVDVRKRIKDIDRITKPAAETVRDLARQLDSARKTLGAMDGATPDKVTAITLQLSQAIATLAPRVQSMVALIESAKRT